MTKPFASIHARLAAATMSEAVAKDDLKNTRALRETMLINSGAAGGKNETERERSLIVALAGDDEYQTALASYRAAKSHMLECEAELAEYNDLRRSEEWNVRIQMVNAIMRRSAAAQIDRPDDSLTDAALDTEVDADALAAFDDFTEYR